MNFLSISPKPLRLMNKRYVLFSLINLFVSISFSMVSTTMSRYIHGIGMTVAVAGAVTGAFSIAAMVIRPFTGFVSDRFSRKKLLVFSNAFMACCTFLYSLTNDPNVLLLLRVLHGLAFGISSTVNMAVIPGFVPENRIGEAISYFGLCQSLAVAVGPSIGLALAGSGGFGLTFAVSALLTVVGVVIALAIDFKGPERPESTVAPKRLSVKFSDIIAVECLIYAAVDIAIASASGLENSFIALYGAAVGIENIGWYFTLSAVTLIVSRLIFGKLADKKGTGFALYPGIAMIMIGMIILWRQSAPWMFAAAAVIKTLGVGMVRPAIQAASVKAVPPERRGAASSTYYFGSDIGQGTSPLIGGKIVDATGGNYGLAFGIYTLPLAAACFLYGLYTKRQKQKAQKVDAQAAAH